MMKTILGFLTVFLALASCVIEAKSAPPYYCSENVAEKMVDVGGAKLFCRALGEGSPLIVLHGGPGLTQDYLLPQMYRLAEGRAVVFYDQRGCGESTGEINPDTINIETYVSDLEAVRKAYNFDKISILGHSWGGFFAMKYAIAHPERVEKLILSNSVPASSEGFNLFIQEYLRRTAPLQDQLADIYASQGFLEGDMATTEKMYRLIFREYCYQPEKAELLTLRMTPKAELNGRKVYACIQESIFSKQFDLHSDLKKLKIPTLIIHGDDDIIPPNTAEQTHASIEGSRFVLMKDCSHFPYVEDPEVYFNHVNAFLQSR